MAKFYPKLVSVDNCNHEILMHIKKLKSSHIPLLQGDYCIKNLNWTLFIEPLQVVYACCQVSQTFCGYISNSTKHMESLLGILMGKVKTCPLDFDVIKICNGKFHKGVSQCTFTLLPFDCLIFIYINTTDLWLVDICIP